MTSSSPRTRLAPSPTGALHLGNARTFLVNWALARQQGWEIVLRIEDLDGPRIQPGAAQQAMEILTWLGLDWDEGPYAQAHHLTPYRQALAQLAARGEVYPCHCTRSEIEAANRSAPHGDHHDLRYPGHCRPTDSVPLAADQLERDDCGWRLRVPPGVFSFHDQFAGHCACNIAHTVGDFQVSTKGQIPSYQLAVVIDDARQGINRIVRGDDLISSTPRQLLLYERLGLAPRPKYWHVPLVIGPDGRRLAKRHGDTRLASYAAAGVAAEQIIGLLAEWCGCGPRRPMTASEFAERFSLERLPPSAVLFHEEDHRWLIR